MGRILLVAGLCAGMAACASAPREQAAQLARSGADASDAAALEVRDLSGRLDRQEELTAFTATWETCVELSDPTGCEPVRQSDANAREVDRLIAAINLRADALTALADAYRALGLEAGYDAEGAMETVVGRLTGSVNAYADLIQPGSGGLVGGPLGGALTHGVGLLARDRQRTRLRAGSARIREAVTLLRRSLGGEAQLFNSLSGTFAQQESAAVEALYDAALIDRAPLLKPMADDLGVNLTPGAEQILATNPSARGAALAYLQGQADDRVRLQRLRYDAILRTLAKLEAAHADLEATGSPDIADLNRAVADLAALVPSQGRTGR